MQEKQPIPSYNYPVEEEFSFRKALLRRRVDVLYLWSNKIILIIAVLIAAVFGAIIAALWPVTYTARLTFVVEESKNGGGGSIVSALAGQMGFDLSGSFGSGGGILAGDNVQELLHSEKIIKNTLLTAYSAKQTLLDRYADIYGFKKASGKISKEHKEFTFSADTRLYSRQQDSIMKLMIKQLAEKEVSIGKPDKKLSFFELSVTTKNELLSKLICDRLIKEAADFYIQTKTSRLRTNVNRLQTRADSLGHLLNRKTYSASEASQVLLDLNPAYTTANVSSELQERDKMVLSTIYSEVIKNLEVNRTMLAQETPAFQLVDEPDLPLKKNRLGYAKSMVLCMFLAGIFASAILLFKRNLSS